MEERLQVPILNTRLVHRDLQTLISFLVVQVLQIIDIGACILMILLFGMVVN